MLRLAMLAALISCCGFFTGCCSGPCGGCGPSHGPLESLVMMKKQLACGAGCCETYYGEWRSHPPDCQDPCDFDYTYHGGYGGGCGGGGGGCGGGVGCSWNSCYDDCNDPCLFSPPPRRRPLLGLFAAIYGDRYCEGCDTFSGGCDWGGYHDVGPGCGDCAGGDCGCGGGYASNGRAPIQQGTMMASQQQRSTNGRMVRRTPQQIPEPRRVARQPSSQPSQGRQR